jgi:hypothetical protein
MSILSFFKSGRGRRANIGGFLDRMAVAGSQREAVKAIAQEVLMNYRRRYTEDNDSTLADFILQATAEAVLPDGYRVRIERESPARTPSETRREKQRLLAELQRHILEDIAPMNNERKPLLSDDVLSGIEIMDNAAWLVRERYERLITEGKLRVVEHASPVHAQAQSHNTR